MEAIILIWRIASLASCMNGRACKQYCIHLAKGKSKKLRYFEHLDFTLTSETIKKTEGVPT